MIDDDPLHNLLARLYDSPRYRRASTGEADALAAGCVHLRAAYYRLRTRMRAATIDRFFLSRPANFA